MVNAINWFNSKKHRKYRVWHKTTYQMSRRFRKFQNQLILLPMVSQLIVVLLFVSTEKRNIVRHSQISSENC